jgi:hypothetical protein
MHLKGNSFSYELSSSGERREHGVNLDTAIITTIRRVDVRFIGANVHPRLVALDPTVEMLNYYNAEGGAVLGVHVYRTIIYHDLYPNIDLLMRVRDAAGNEKQNTIKYDLIVRDGGDLRNVKISYEGAERINVTDSAVLIMTPLGAIEEYYPSCYRRTLSGDNRKIHIAIHAVGSVISFIGDDEDDGGDLVVDPLIVWSTYYGGGGGLDYAYGIAISAERSIYVTGRTNSSTNIATSGSYQSTIAGSDDAYIACFDSSGYRTWATYYGGSGSDIGRGIVLGSTGDLFVYGFTNSSSGISTAGAYQVALAGGTDCFLARFTTAGTMVWGTYFGGAGTEEGALYEGIAADNNGTIVFTGRTTSDNGIATSGSHQTTKGGGYDAFVAKFSESGSLLWSTYYGGSNTEYGEDVAIDMGGNIIVVGHTQSSNGIASSSAQQASYGGGSADAFIAKITSAGVRLWGTYYGGASHDVAMSAATTSQDTIYIVGYTESASGITTSGAYQTTFGGVRDGVILKLTPDGARVWASYYGGESYDGVDDIAIINGDLLLAGKTLSSTGIATPGDYQSAKAGDYDSFIARITGDGTRKWGTYFGGNIDEGAVAITYDGDENIIIAGATASTTGIAYGGRQQGSHGGGTYDSYIAKYTDATSSAIVTSPLTNKVLHGFLWT